MSKERTKNRAELRSTAEKLGQLIVNGSSERLRQAGLRGVNSYQLQLKSTGLKQQIFAAGDGDEQIAEEVATMACDFAKEKLKKQLKAKDVTIHPESIEPYVLAVTAYFV